MSYFYDLSVGEIRVVATKEEGKRFDYFNPCRFGDGFVFFYSGNGFIKWSDGVKCEIKAGTLVLLRKGDEYRLCVDAPCSYTVTDYDLVCSSPLPKTCECNEEEMRILQEIGSTYEKRENTCLIKLRALILSLYSKLLDKTEKKQSDYLACALSFIFKNYDENFSVENVASACGVSPSHLRATFKKETGFSIFAYREKLRVEKAKQMLKSNVFAIKEIADSLGYFDVYHFSKKFKAATGFAPNEYRKSAE